MENKKGSGIFLGVVSVATLIVAIIGATFAYFSTQTNSANNAVNVSAYEFATTVTSVERIYPTEDALKGLAGQGIIPLNPTAEVKNATGGETNLLYALNNKSCVDDRGYMVCALYKVTLTNNSVAAAELNLDLRTNAINKFTDLTFQALTGEENNFTLNGKAATIGTADTSVTIKNDSDQKISLTVPAKSGEVAGTLVHYFTVYLNEPTSATDQNAQMGGTFTGELVYTTTTGGNRLTGEFTIGG